VARKFEKQIQIRFREADPAGILFFGHVLSLAHDVFEDFIPATGLTWADYFQAKEHIAPIRHAEIDFLAPMRPGHPYEVSVTILKISDSSFQTKTVFSEGSKQHAVVKTVHTFLNSKSFQKIPVPEKFRQAFTPYLEATP
jgi:acyl-CoA thioester hydrolase/1,4-dihydroxy-2-naphthoyl-CoA hydrolase